MTAPALPRPTGSEPCRRAPDRWFGKGISDQQAAAMCSRCPLREPCLAWAIVVDEPGVWGGTTWEQRDAYRKAHHIVPVSLASMSGVGIIEHGHERGAKAHRRRHERPCEPCRKADVLAHAERKQVRAG